MRRLVYLIEEEERKGGISLSDGLSVSSWTSFCPGENDAVWFKTSNTQTP